MPRSTFFLTPGRACLAQLLPVALLLASPQSMARVIDNATEVIDSGNSADRYQLRNGADLTATDTNTFDIQVTRGSTLTLQRSQVTASGTDDGVAVSGSTARITSSILSGGVRASGLSVGDDASGVSRSEVNVLDSAISGGRSGALVNGQSRLNLSNSNVSGTQASSYGLIMSGGNVFADASTVSGGTNGVWIAYYPLMTLPSTLILDNGSQVTGQNGSAIVVDGFDFSQPVANIEVRNNSKLTGSNGTLLDVKGGATGNLLVNNSHLTGDVIADAGSTATVQLENFATLTGRLDTVERLSINSDATWMMVGNADIKTLSMNGGLINFGTASEYFNLSAQSLSGNGTFIMDADFTTGQVDTLDVTGTATGNHRLLMGSSGADPTAAGAIPVVHIAAGDAQFSLLNGPVDLGTYSYDLIKQGDNDWYLDTTSRVISPGTQSVLALFNAAPTVWYGELSTLRSRMGEIRLDHGKAGGWMRAYGNRFDVDARSGVAYRQTQQGLSFGADAPMPVGDGQWLVGVLGGYSQSDLNLSGGTSGEVNSYYLGAYSTWLDAQSGYYVDGVLKFNRFQNESKVQLSDGAQAKGRYDNHGVGASLEFGRHIKLANDYFVEPYSQLSGVIIQGKDYSLDNGMAANGSRTHSLLGKVGATTGRNIDLGSGKVVQPYVRAAYVHEFANNNGVRVNSNTFNNDLSGSRGELGVGVAMNVTDTVSIHADFDYSNGNHIDQPWGSNVGIRYSW